MQRGFSLGDHAVVSRYARSLELNDLPELLEDQLLQMVAPTTEHNF